MKKALLVFAALCLLVLSGCAGKTYSFIRISGGEAAPAEAKNGFSEPLPCLVYTADGDVFYSENYKHSQPLVGLIEDPSCGTVMDAAKRADKWLEGGERVMIIYVDGLGRDAYWSALEAGLVPNLAALDQSFCAAVYPTITPVNYAAMVTGEPPKTNGVTGRGIHQIACETIFDRAAAAGLRSFVSEGDTQILALPGAEMELSPDLNGNGTGDDEILDCALEHTDVSLLFVHFHGVDDASHAYGPGSPEADAAIADADARCGKLLAAWDGRVVILADHGQHVQDGTGDPAYADRRGTHGDFAPSDIFVPFLTR